MKFERITIESEKMGGVPCVRGLRIPVATILKLFSEGMQAPEILSLYPDLTEPDLRECLRFAASAVEEREIPLAS